MPIKSNLSEKELIIDQSPLLKYIQEHNYNPRRGIAKVCA